MSTYLAAFSFSDYVKLTDTSSEGVPLEYFVFPELVDEAIAEFQNVPDMVSFFSSIHPYPYPRYAMSLGYFPGGMEHVMNSLIGYFFITGERVQESLYSHELAHQWWGDLVTLDSWRHIWLNEGFATYCERLYTEHRYGWNAMRDITARIDSLYAARLDLDHPVLDPPLSRVFSFIVYLKGGRVLDMLRGVSRLRLMEGGPRAPEENVVAALAGDARFFGMFSDYADAHAYGTATTADLVAAAEAALAEDLDWFFTPWLQGTGLPQLRAFWIATRSARSTRIDVAILQEQTTTLFRMPLQVRYVSGETVLDEVREIDGRSTSWSVELPPGTWNVVLDPDDWLMDEHTGGAVPAQARRFEVTPNPSRAGFTLNGSIPGSEPIPVTLFIADLQGRRVRTWNLGPVAGAYWEQPWDGRNEEGTPVPAGMYVAVADVGGSRSTRKLILLR
jgi:aminopeptidase N